MDTEKEKSGGLEKLNLDEMDFIETWKAVVFNPTNFFKYMPAKGGYKKPLFFAVLCHLPTILIKDLFLFFRGFPYLSEVIIFYIVVNILLIPIELFMVGVLFQMSAVAFAKETYGEFEGTVRLLSYATATNVVSWIPIINVFAITYQLYLIWNGIKEVHKTTGLRALAILSIPAIVAAVAAVLLFIP